MNTSLTQKFPFILDRNLAKSNGTENHVCTFCETLWRAIIRKKNVFTAYDN